MTWTFEINETSNGVYSCKGIRDTGNVVFTQCREDELHKVFKHAYDLEVELGTLPSRALFLIVSGTKPQWASQYHDEAFGSWTVSNQNKSKKFVYDGKDFWLMIYESKNTPVWQGKIREKEDAEDSIFKLIK